MKVVEKDKVIGGMLQDELRRCQEMLDNLEKAASVLPKGVLNERKKRYKSKIYSYYYLKYRDGNKVINKHISNESVPEVRNLLAERKKIELEMRGYKRRIDYLGKILGQGKGK